MTSCYGCILRSTHHYAITYDIKACSVYAKGSIRNQLMHMQSAAKLEKSLNESFKLQRSSEMVNEVKHLQKVCS